MRPTVPLHRLQFAEAICLPHRVGQFSQIETAWRRPALQSPGSADMPFRLNPVLEEINFAWKYLRISVAADHFGYQKSITSFWLSIILSIINSIIFAINYCFLIAKMMWARQIFASICMNFSDVLQGKRRGTINREAVMSRWGGARKYSSWMLMGANRVGQAVPQNSHGPVLRRHGPGAEEIDLPGHRRGGFGGGPGGCESPRDAIPKLTNVGNPRLDIRSSFDTRQSIRI